MSHKRRSEKCCSPLPIVPAVPTQRDAMMDLSEPSTSVGAVLSAADAALHGVLMDG